MKNLALALGLMTALLTGAAKAEVFSETTGPWTITSIENKGEGPKMRCLMRLKGIPDATGDGFRIFALSDFYVKASDGTLAERAAVSVVLGPGTLGTENSVVENVTVSTAPGNWSAPVTGRWFSRDTSGSLALIVQTSLQKVAGQIAKGDALRVNIPSSNATKEALSIAIPLSGSAKALGTLEKCRKANR